jgi:hypothetical protein
LERPAKDKRSSLLRIFVNYGCIKFYNIGPRLTKPEPVDLEMEDLKELFKKIDPNFDLKDFKEPSSGSWNIRESARQSLKLNQGPML